MDESKERKILNHLYGALLAITALSFIPQPQIAALALAGFVGILIFLYIIKEKANDNGLLENHCLFLIKTIWVMTFISVGTLAAALAYFIPTHDRTAIDACTLRIVEDIVYNSDISIVYARTFVEFMIGYIELTAETFKRIDSLYPCIQTFLTENQNTLINTAIIAFGLPIVYFLYRLYKGGARAVKGYRVANPKSWI